jgi:DDHD domain
VDVERRELAPVYWLGPIYDVRRGTWFYAESSGLRPCDENLATQLEEGYLKVQPWNFSTVTAGSRSQTPLGRTSSLRRSDQRSSSSKPAVGAETTKEPEDGSKERTINSNVSQKDIDKSPQAPLKSFRLFGTHMNSVVTYEDSTTAYIVAEGYLAAMSGTIYERFSGGAHFAGTKVVRGYTEQTKKAGAVDGKVPPSPTVASPIKESLKSVAAPVLSPEEEVNDKDRKHIRRSKRETHRQALERKMSSLVGGLDAEQEEEEVRKRDEEEMREDYNEDDIAQQGREIEHLILITHGIGQRLGLRLESVNFIHDVNTLRKTLKSVYNDSADLQALNGETEKEIKNCRIQVLPICWRHLLDFPKQSLKHNRMEHDIGDGEDIRDEEYPTLEDITVEGVPAIRNLITDLGLDILLYQSPVYKPHISKIVLEECNRTYKLFKTRHPSFKGKVSLIGHSLGAAIMFDLLCNQNLDAASPSLSRQFKADPRMQLDFEVKDFYAFGSPIGLFQMLKGRTIAARHSPNVKPAQTPFGQTIDPFSQNSAYLEITTSSPKCRQIFNIFHPTDPIAYRLEPLISSALASMTPQPLPYTKKGIFGAPVGQGFTSIGARVGQSVSSIMSSFSTGIATSLLNRTLGISNEEAGRLSNPLPTSLSALATNKASNPSSTPERPSTSNSNSGASSSTPADALSLPLSVEDAKRLIARGSTLLETGEEGENPPTLLNTGLETLYSGFQKVQDQAEQAGSPLDGPAVRQEVERVKREENKVRALNKNGRVDYSIQE